MKSLSLPRRCLFNCNSLFCLHLDSFKVPSMLNKITINFIIDSIKLWQWGSFFCSSNTFICCQWLIKWVGWGGFKSSISWHIPCLNRFGEYEANWLWLITAALGVVVPSWADSRLQCCCWSSTQQWREAAVDPQSKRYHQRPTRSLACFFHRIKTEILQLGLFLSQELMGFCDTWIDPGCSTCCER